MIDKRRAIVTGEIEAPENETKEGKKALAAEAEAVAPGVPEFWLTALRNHPELDDMVRLVGCFGHENGMLCCCLNLILLTMTPSPPPPVIACAAGAGDVAAFDMPPVARGRAPRSPSSPATPP